VDTRTGEGESASVVVRRVRSGSRGQVVNDDGDRNAAPQDNTTAARRT
jgi:hypothetical protein